MARMMGEAAAELDVELTVLAASPDDSAISTCDHYLIGEATDPLALAQLAALVDVITFDHELLDLEEVARLEAGGALVRPGSRALRYSVDKAHQRREFHDAGLSVPAFLVVDSARDDALYRFLGRFDRVVVKSARGGYDGRGVLFPRDRDEATSMVEELARQGEVVVEERLELLGELAQVVVRGVEGECVAYPLVRSVQADAMCVEVTYPALVDHSIEIEAEAVARRIAELIGAVGVLAVEYFFTPAGLVVNEIALRPHNTAHWTIEGCATNQFANHLLAVSAAPLGPADAVVEAAVMVNVVGGDAPGSLERAHDIEGAHVHDYGKSWRPGRKLGHVTVVGDDLSSAHVRAWESARAYGTRTREA